MAPKEKGEPLTPLSSWLALSTEPAAAGEDYATDGMDSLHSTAAWEHIQGVMDSNPEWFQSDIQGEGCTTPT